MNAGALLQKDVREAVFGYATYAIVAFAVAAYFLFSLMFTAVIVTDVFPQWLEGARDDNSFRNWLELLYFISNLGLLGVAAYAVRFARHQAITSEHSQLSNVYMQITAQWWEPEFIRSRSLLTVLIREAESTEPGAMPEAVNAFLKQKRVPPTAAPEAPGGTEARAEPAPSHADYLQIMRFFEDVGLLCRKEYVRKEDVFDFIAASIQYYISALLPHILFLRRDHFKSQTIYANALWLHQECRGYESYSFDDSAL